MRYLSISLIITSFCGAWVSALPRSANAMAESPPCFPALGFNMPTSTLFDDPLKSWWCNAETEYAFLGFSYEVEACQSLQQLTQEFLDMRNRFNSRYVRLYGACDREGFYDDIVEAAWTSGLGVHALIWFGFDSDDIWINRRDTLFAALHSNPRAKFVTRVVQFGSEPLFDDVLPHQELTSQVMAAQANLSSLGIPVTVSEMAYGYQERGGAQDVLDAVNSINIHMLPFFSQKASTGTLEYLLPNGNNALMIKSTANKSWDIVLTDLEFFVDHGKGKKMYFDENGWPSVTSSGVQPNSPDAVADVQNEHDYYALLDRQCEFLKTVIGGGVGWFAHIYSDDQEPGYGIYDNNGNLKFNFSPRTYC